MSQQIQLSSSRSRRPYCCSFCGEQGHNYISCTSGWFADFEQLCAARANSLGTRNLFKEWLWDIYSEDILLLKMFCVRKFRVSRVSLDVNLDERICLELITDYIFATYFNNLEIELVRLLTELQNLRESEPMQDLFNIFGSEDNFVGYTHASRLTRKMNIKLSVDSKMLEDTMCECSICYDEIKSKNFVKLTCNHEFCKDCMIKTIQTQRATKVCCALCRTEIESIQTKTEKIKENFEKIIVA